MGAVGVDKGRKRVGGRRLEVMATAAVLVGAAALASACMPPEAPAPATTTTVASTTTITSTTVPSDATALAVTGHLEYFGQAQVGPRQIRVRTYGADHSEIVLVPGGYFITVDATAPYGSFSTVIPLRSDVRSVNLIVELHTPEGTAWFPSGSYAVQADQQTSAVYNTHGSFVQLDATFLMDGQPVTGPFYASIQAYDANESSYGLALQTPVYPDPLGRAEVTMYVPYDSFAGGDASTDPATVNFDFYGFDGSDASVLHTVDLDEGAAFYREAQVFHIESDGAAH